MIIRTLNNTKFSIVNASKALSVAISVIIKAKANEPLKPFL